MRKYQNFFAQPWAATKREGEAPAEPERARYPVRGAVASVRREAFPPSHSWLRSHLRFNTSPLGLGRSLALLITLSATNSRVPRRHALDQFRRRGQNGRLRHWVVRRAPRERWQHCWRRNTARFVNPTFLPPQGKSSKPPGTNVAPTYYESRTVLPLLSRVV